MHSSIDLAPPVAPAPPFDESFEQVVGTHLARILRSSEFDASARSREFLRFIVNEALTGREQHLNQTEIAMHVFGRKADFDPVLDPIVRVQAVRLRRSLERYYLLSESTEPVRIELPRGGYVPTFVTVEPRAPDITPIIDCAAPAPAARESHWPRVMIHNFTGAGDDAMALRVQDHLTREMCQYGDIHVACERDMRGVDLMLQPETRFDLHGNLRRDGDDYLVSARLVDRLTAEQIWSDEYHTTSEFGRWSSSVDDIGRIIAARISGEFGVVLRLLAGELGSGHRHKGGQFEPLLRCYRLFMSCRLHDLPATLAELECLTATAPEMPAAWGCLARCFTVNHALELTAANTPIDKAIGHAYRAVMLDPSGARARCILAEALLVKGEVDAAREVLEKTLRLNPDSLAYREIVGLLLALAGDWERGMTVMRDAMERNPYCSPEVSVGLWADHLLRGDFSRAYGAALEYRDPCLFWREIMMTSSLGHLGRSQEARASGAELLQLKPDFRDRGRVLIGNFIKSEPLLERIVEGLRKADLVLAPTIERRATQLSN